MLCLRHDLCILSGVTRLLLMPGQRAGKPPTHAAHIHMSDHLHMDISIDFKICCTSYFVCKISILAIAMIHLQVYEQYRLIQAPLVP